MKKYKSKRGISLIVLVITIIVMIILAVAIILSISNSEIIEKANMAKEDSNKASAKEIISVAHSEWLLMNENEKNSNGKSFVTYAENKLQEKGYKAEDYIIQETGEAELCVAKIGETKYASLQDAVDSAPVYEETEIVVVNDINEQIKVYTNRILTIDLNGYSINATGNAIRNSGKLTIKDSSENKTSRIKASSNKSLYIAKYDLNADGVVGQEDIDLITKYYGKSSDEEDWNEFKKYDINNDSGLNVSDMTYIGEHTNDAYAIFNGKDAKLTLQDISLDKLIGNPSAIYNKEEEE